MVANWLGFETMSHGYLFDHLVHLGELEGESFSKHIRLVFSII